MNKQWTNEKRTVLVEEWEDGTMTVATREDADCIWGPPVYVKHQPDVRNIQADFDAGEREGEYVGEHTEDISYKFGS